MAAHGHSAADRRNLHLHRVALARLRAQPELRAACVSLIDRWLAGPDLDSAADALRRWREMLLDWPVERIEAVVLSGDGGQELRQCSPLGPVLTPRERWRALEELALP